MKKEYIQSCLFFITMFLFGYWIYPEHIRSLERESLFLLTPDYLSDHLSAPMGLTQFCTNFLLQFYKWSMAGAFIQAVFPFIVLCLSSCFLKKLRLQSYRFLAYIPAIICWINQNNWAPAIIVQYCLFIGMLTFYISIRKDSIRYLAAFFSVPILYTLLPESYLIILYLYYIIHEVVLLKGRNVFLIPVINLLFVIIIPPLWSRVVSYIPIDQLYEFSDPENIFSHPYIVYLLLLLPAACLILPKLKERSMTIVAWGLPFLLLAAGGLLLYFSSSDPINEKFFRIQQYAEEQKWDNLLEEITPEDAENDKYQRYITLALSGKNELSEKLFSFPVQNPESFNFTSKELAQFSADFNSLFYHNLGLNNEAIHQAFQMGILSKEGMSFAALRRLVDWHIEKGNLPTANKYMDILSTSTAHQAWINERKHQIASIPANTEKTQLPADFLLDNTSILMTLTQIVQSDTTNRKAIDYLLCSVLLGKDLKGFFTLFQQYYPAHTSIPVLYQEALLLTNLMFPQLNALQSYVITDSCKNAFEEFGVLMAQRPGSDSQLKQKYETTYWYYGFVRNK